MRSHCRLLQFWGFWEGCPLKEEELRLLMQIPHVHEVQIPDVFLTGLV